jgi:predicted lactoylglutathione lyase
MKQSEIPVVSALQYIGRKLAPYKSAMAIAGVGFLLGILWLVGMRFLTIQTEETHYHANFAVFINGEREQFKSFAYYEEIAACSTAYVDNPKGRVHMHENVNDVIHVHDKRVTYQDFFTNIGWSVGPDFIHSDTTLYVNNENAVVMYMLNGQQVDRIEGRVIGDKDRLLISYGPADTDLEAQFKNVASTAEEVDAKQDPASCSGLNGPGGDSFTSRLRRATFWE